MVQRCPAAAGQRPCTRPISRNPGTHSRRRTSPAIPGACNRSIHARETIPTTRTRSSPAASTHIHRAPRNPGAPSDRNPDSIPRPL